MKLGEDAPQARQKPRADDDAPFISIDDKNSTAALPHPAMALFVLLLSLYPMKPPTARARRWVETLYYEIVRQRL